MPIEFHCSHCNHLIRAPGEHAGKRGKCPHCKNSVYIPTPSEEIELFTLAPIDPAEEREKERLREETRALAQRIRGERDEIADSGRGGSTESPAQDARLPIDVEGTVVEYLAAMANGDLSTAEGLADDLRPSADRVREVIDRMTMDDLPPMRLAKIPRALLNGFLKQLREAM